MLYICIGNSSTQLIIFLFMEIRIYRSQDQLRDGKHFYCARIANPDAFDFNRSREMFQCIYGTDIVFVVISL